MSMNPSWSSGWKGKAREGRAVVFTQRNGRMQPGVFLSRWAPDDMGAARSQGHGILGGWTGL